MGVKSNFLSVIYDIMPTLLYYMGIPIPGDVDGRPLKEIFTMSFQENNNAIFRTGKKPSSRISWLIQSSKHAVGE